MSYFQGRCYFFRGYIVINVFEHWISDFYVKEWNGWMHSCQATYMLEMMDSWLMVAFLLWNTGLRLFILSVRSFIGQLGVVSKETGSTNAFKNWNRHLETHPKRRTPMKKTWNNTAFSDLKCCWPSNWKHAAAVAGPTWFRFLVALLSLLPAAILKTMKDQVNPHT